MRKTLTRAWRSLRRFVGWVPPQTSIADEELTRFVDSVNTKEQAHGTR